MLRQMYRLNVTEWQMILNNELGTMYNKATVASFKALSQHFPGCSEIIQAKNVQIAVLRT